MSYVRLQIKVGKAWVPAHLGVMSRDRAEALRDRYKVERPQAQTRIIPETA